MRSSLNLA